MYFIIPYCTNHKTDWRFPLIRHFSQYRQQEAQQRCASTVMFYH